MLPIRTLLQSRTVRFLIVGGSASLLLLTLTYVFLRGGVRPPFLAGLCAYGVSFVYGYLLQRNWTFDGVGSHARTLPRYFALQFTLAMVSGGLSQVLTNSLKWPPAEASIIMTLCVSAISYFGSSRWVFAARAPR
jgi:putative flippase GtrA